MNYLLDTDAISELIKPRPNPGLVAWLSGVDEDRTHLSAVTMGELRRGINRLPPDGNRRTLLEHWLDNDLPARFERRLLSADIAVSLAWGALRAAADRSGRSVDPIDALIAATAIANRLTVVTRNIRHFEVIDVPVLCPWDAEHT
ncbi:type II toxin-antitoxin system VapC family toxin [Nocardia neocaledoniensis]|uniref:type II toxin-antitoxin system VapC family toxin n=1 Tax=Nocardia neocaledoniensis TaxID=236511 RepID=UPI002457542F|nr:type II toxin-antitoxin system VapC family toxin [Nocardia neocaledoniensis]